MLFNIINYLLLIKISLAISLFTSIFKFVILPYSTHWLIIVKDFILNYGIKNKIIIKFLVFTKNFTYWFFTKEPTAIIKTVTIISGLSLGLSFITRLAIINAIIIPGISFFLLYFAVNAVFRAIITLGILLNKGDLLRQLLERLARNNASHDLPAIYHESNNNKNHQDNSEKFNKKAEGTNWGKWGALGSIVGGVGGGVAIYDSFQEKIENRDAKQRTQYYEDALAHEKRRNENLDQLKENFKERAALQKERADIQEQRANFEKERADALERKFAEFGKR